ncbi:WD repeat and HMG box DNA binding protein 1 [Paragonimus heterotremus]|uniref:WD repeat and HMG box DNA binding protein 1 n=1 Tax=Paragonimus heterotremus TaxID=100268 RepID=A0A8J4SYA8_9TREM|nr:WD repeat and HMG box DNA binding protein 1 [Paragonimus heterotremus]
MSFVKSPFHQHKQGWTTAIFDSTGERIISAGVDGKVKVLDSVDDTCPLEHVIGEKVNAIVCRQDTIILATEGTHVHMIQIEDGLPEGLATRFTADVTHLVLNKDHTKLAVCSSDFLIKIIHFASVEDREFTLEGHTGGVLSLAFDPLDVFISSSSCDGTVRIWRIDEKREVKSIRSISPCNDPALALSVCRLCWDSAEGKFLAIPIDKQIGLYERNTWDLLCSLSCPTITQPIVVCVSSFDGSLLASGSEDGWIVVWCIEDRQPLHRLRDPSHSGICSLVWHPYREGLMLYANKNGFIALIRLPENQPTVNGGLSPRTMNTLMGCDEDGDTDELLRAAAAQAESSRLLDEDEAQKLLDLPTSDLDGDDDVNSIDLSRIKSGYMALDDDAEDVGDGLALKTEPGVLDGLINPIQAAMVGSTSRVPSSSSDVVLTKHIQKPFQSGSMPLGFRERFMVWNRIGVVTQYRGTGGLDDAGEDDALNPDGDAVGSIEVEFHDAVLHHSLRLSNSAGYTMADLSLTALLLASPGSNDPTLVDNIDTGEPIDYSDVSRITVLPLDTSNSGVGVDSTTSEWSAKLPPGEACDAVCLVPHDDPCERGYAAVATSRRFVRVFAQPSPSVSLLRSSAGLHLFQLTKLGLPPISLPGCGVVTMSSHPSRPILGVVVTTITAELHWRLYYLGGALLGHDRTKSPTWLTGSLSTWNCLPLSPALSALSDDRLTAYLSARLTWFGFSDLGGLYTHDASGVVRRLIHGRTSNRPEYHWVPVGDTRSHLKPSNRRSDTFFLVGILESTESVTLGHTTTDSKSQCDLGLGQLQTIYCKASKWPRVFPRPVLSSLSFRLPLCSLGTDQADLELAAKLESDWASLAVARLMPDAATVQLAIRYAGRLRRQHLAQRLAAIALDKERTTMGTSPYDSDSSACENGYDAHLVKKFSSVHSRKSNKPHHEVTESPSRNDPWLSTGRTYSQRHPSGNRDETDLSNVSLVSSATDDTHDESALPLPDSEPMSQTLHLSNTPSSVARNPFREAPTPESNIALRRKESTAAVNRGRGSEILDNWRPSETATSGTNSKQGPVKTNSRSGKKRTAPVLSTEGVTFEETPAEAFEVSTAETRLKPESGHLSDDLCAIHSTELEADEKENQLVPNVEQLLDVGKDAKTHKMKSSFAEKASKKLSSFKFQSN